MQLSYTATTLNFDINKCMSDLVVHLEYSDKSALKLRMK